MNSYFARAIAKFLAFSKRIVDMETLVECQCQNGTPPKTGEGLDSWFGHIISLDNELKYKKFWLNRFSCPPEKFKSSKPDWQYEKCASCNPGYSLNEVTEKCEKNVCFCDFGIAATGADCTTKNGHICKSCTEELHNNMKRDLCKVFAHRRGLGQTQKNLYHLFCQWRQNCL